MAQQQFYSVITGSSGIQILSDQCNSCINTRCPCIFNSFQLYFTDSTFQGASSSMFTGIIECMGTITRAQRRSSSIILLIQPDNHDFTVTIGGSVAIDGICLTLEQRVDSALQFSAVAETLNRTTLIDAHAGKLVNLERAALLGSRLDGHLVYGHVDGIGSIVHDQDMGGSTLRTISFPDELSAFMAQKGSVAIDGISLTITRCSTHEITISLIPHTMKNTTLSLKRPGDKVNIECDIVARYLQRLMQTGNHPDTPSQGSLLSLLERSGF